MSEWRTIDSAPKDGTTVLLFCKEPVERRMDPHIRRSRQ